MADRSNPVKEASVGELVQGISRDLSQLVRQEIELARVEMTEKARTAGVGAGILGGAGVATLAALGALTAFLILVLDLVIPAWAAALAVTVLWGAVAAVLALRGREKVREVDGLAPEQTVETVQEDVEWANQSVRRGTSSRAAADRVARRQR